MLSAGKYFFLLIFFLFPFYHLNSEERNSDTLLYQNAQWKNLLRYRFHLSGYKSEADGPSFFFSSTGKNNLKEEWQANQEKLGTPWEKFKNNPDDHPICRFPARFLFMKKQELGEKKAQDILQNCSEYQKFVAKLSAKSLSLVFSSYYLDTPASAFGHTLIRFNKYKIDEKTMSGSELLDYASNYAATVTSDNAFVYAFMGIVGGFRGEFTNMPYFYKVREYNDFESRDLWDYQLNLTPFEIEMVVAHLWEMKQTHFDYFYLTENCSYHMLGLLDVANPNWHLTKRTPYFAIPIDTVRVVAQTPGLVHKITFRPSKKRVLETRLKELGPDQKLILKNLIKDYNPNHLPASLSPSEKALILDAAIDHIDFKKASEILLENKEVSKTKLALLMARGETRIIAKDLEVNIPTHGPHQGHGTRRLSMGMSSFSKSGLANVFEYRFALHDLMDPNLGQNRDSSMEMGRFRFNYFPKNKIRNNTSQLRLEEFSLVNVVSLNPLKEFFSGISFKANVGGKQIKDDACKNCFAAVGKLASGLSFRPVDQLLVASFLTSEINASKRLSKQLMRIGIGPELDLIWDLASFIKISTSGSYQRTFLETEKSKYLYQWGGSSTIIPRPLHPSFYIRLWYNHFEQEEESALALSWAY